MLRNLLKGVVAAGVLIAGTAIDAQAGVVYSNDFQSGVATGFSGFTTVTTAPNSEKFIGIMTFGSTATLALSGLAAHSTVTLDFDVYGLRSLDGGNDAFRLRVNGNQVFSDPYAHNGTGFNGPTTGQAQPYNPTAFGYGCFYACEQTFHYSLTFNDSASAISFAFIGSTDQSWSDEGFGLDNVVVRTNAVASTVPEPASLALAGLGLAGLGFTRRKLASRAA